MVLRVCEDCYGYFDTLSELVNHQVKDHQSCALCGESSDKEMKVINGHHTCELCADLAREGEGK